MYVLYEKNILLLQAMAFFVHVMEPVVIKDYIIVYFHAGSQSDHLPDSSFFKQLYLTVDEKYVHPSHLRHYTHTHTHTHTLYSPLPSLPSLLPNRYKRNLKALFVVHPNWWLKVIMKTRHLNAQPLSLP